MRHFSAAARAFTSQATIGELGLVEDGVVYRKHYNRAGALDITLFDYIPMLDWDWKDPIHSESAVTIEDLNDVVRILQQYLSRVSQHIRVYLTPSGVHAFLLARPILVKDFDWTGLNVDPMYRAICVERQAFAVRVSPKARPKDFVAIYAFTLANCEADPVLLDMLDRHHDRRIQQYFEMRRGLKTQQALEYAQELLAKQM